MPLFSFCTISTSSHLFKAFALANSIAPFKGTLNILVIDEMNDLAQKPENVNIFTLSDLNDHIGIQIIDKYKNNQDKLVYQKKWDININGNFIYKKLWNYCKAAY